MAKGLVEGQKITEIANTIREIDHNSNTYTLDQIPDGIKKLKNKVYKRYVCQGENLSGKKIIFDYNTTYKDYLDLYDNQHSNRGQFIMVGLNDIKFFRNYIPGDHDDSDYSKVYDKYVLKGLNGEDIYVYNPTTGEEETIYLGALYYGDDLIQYLSPMDYIWAYQHIMLEDENIRPIKIGDHFTTGTILYEVTRNTIFNDIVNEKGALSTSNMYNCDIATFSSGGKIYCTSEFVYDDPTYSGFLAEDGSGENEHPLFVACNCAYKSVSEGENHPPKITVSKDMGKIANINDDGLGWSEYFLVDVTTLGD